ncbi:TetR family transcriptional regulator [Sporanaerobium hydrogeniformans]|uniref:TetR family transcriptional regulator n=1 Tax=Sporanaerobium hydrogeniformans TaxID=3072179 RepID=A0AC61DBA1_9FIRM|nr:TetR/AcrR family transcriptional regulator [Sporanaerobium hydrogeniformans]PHV70549.1 TetR family transcriptional regulator [Sporanaerobium hydrogeniformans]
MATAFSEHEKEMIRKALKACALEYMSKYGIKKTTVEQLALGANISKGAFYKFYTTKEELFFEVIEEFHEVIYAKALHILCTRTDLSDAERLEEAFFQACKLAKSYAIMEVLETEMNYLIRKLPPHLLEEHLNRDSEGIYNLIEKANIKLSCNADLISAVTHGIICMLFHTKLVDDKYFDEALRLIIRGACKELVI